MLTQFSHAAVEGDVDMNPRGDAHDVQGHEAKRVLFTVVLVRLASQKNSKFRAV